LSKLKEYIIDKFYIYDTEREEDNSGVGHDEVETYSMKLFDVKILGGQASVTSSEHEGTTFRFSLQVYVIGVQ
jgi:hypothetical protein